MRALILLLALPLVVGAADEPFVVRDVGSFVVVVHDSKDPKCSTVGDETMCVFEPKHPTTRQTFPMFGPGDNNVILVPGRAQ